MRWRARVGPLAAIFILLSTQLGFASSGAALAAPCQLETWGALDVHLRGRAPMIQGSLNGHAFEGLLDTGAFETTLFRGFAERASLDVHQIRGAAIVGVGGKSAVYRTRANHLELGSSMVAENIDLDITWDSKTNANIDAVIGADLLFSHDLELALSSGKARLFRPVGCGDSFLAYWDKQASMVPMERVSSQDQRQMIIVQVNGTDLRALIDSGASRSLIDAKVAARIGIRDDAAEPADAGKLGGAGPRTVDYTVVAITQVTIGREEIRDTKIAMASIFRAAFEDIPAPTGTRIQKRPYDMVLGQDFLMSHRVLCSITQKRLYFSYIGGKVFAVD
ncbi:MAG TPA: aspartyl protease family protein [Burkholderiaceae bacterium]|nr:aspartyl protease family protein [Burkholderiaceae bacterium]